MRKAMLIAAAVLSATFFTGPTGVSAQTGADRKVVDRNPAVYPDLAQRMHLRGTVKLAVTVRASGEVKSSRPLGGNPVLIEAATTAVGKWKFEPAPGETTEVIEFRFGAH
jgi:TonB family protein